jgi:hypothetical protein
MPTTLPASNLLMVQLGMYLRGSGQWLLPTITA